MRNHLCRARYERTPAFDQVVSANKIEIIYFEHTQGVHTSELMSDLLIFAEEKTYVTAHSPK